MDSAKNIGRERNNEEMTYTKMNAAPPCSPARYGNLQMFPSPIADPAIAMMMANLPPKFSLLFSTIL